MFEQVFNKVCRHLGIDSNTVNADANIVSPAEIRRLNKQFRKKDKVTDVLSFPALELSAGTVPRHDDFPLDINHETNKIELGDIIINSSETNKNFLFVHGLLHLLGYDHKTDLDENRMNEITEAILK